MNGLRPKDSENARIVDFRLTILDLLGHPASDEKFLLRETCCLSDFVPTHLFELFFTTEYSNKCLMLDNNNFVRKALASRYFLVRREYRVKNTGRWAESGIGSLWIFLSANSCVDAALKIPPSYIRGSEPRRRHKDSLPVKSKI